MSEKTLLIARHPETQANVENRLVGRCDSPLTVTGSVQLQTLADRIVEFSPDGLWTSPLGRAQVVAKRASRLLGLQVMIDEDLSEMDFGDAEGLTYAEVRARGLSLQYTDEALPIAPEGESLDELRSRTSAVVERVLADCVRPALITHGGAMRMMLVELLSLPVSALWSFDVQNGSSAVVRISEYDSADQWASIVDYRQVRTV